VHIRPGLIGSTQQNESPGSWEEPGDFASKEPSVPRAGSSFQAG
jgi:hypothetical protein